MGFITPSGECLDIPDALYRALRDITASLAQDEAITLVAQPLQGEVGVDEAAEILNTSRQGIMRLLAEDVLPYSMTGAQYCIPLRKLMIYKRRMDAQRREALTRLTQMSQEFGLYDRIALHAPTFATLVRGRLTTGE
jgi:excisionase family DNA binding protein